MTPFEYNEVAQVQTQAKEIKSVDNRREAWRKVLLLFTSAFSYLTGNR